MTFDWLAGFITGGCAVVCAWAWANLCLGWRRESRRKRHLGRHEQFLDGPNIWCHEWCPMPDEECGRLAVEQNG